MNGTTPDSRYMQRALELAEKGRFTVSPNPMTGCVIVNNDMIVGEGFHNKAGHPHAEINALLVAGSKAKGATVYVNLEPCCHYGRTPPCAKALIAAGVKKVVISYLDPNPLVLGKGVAELRSAGIEVEIGLEAERAMQLNEIFNYYITKKKPFVILKWAMSLDGKTIAQSGDSRQISALQTQHHAHELRQVVDAVIVGAKTALIDNPQLTARLDAPENGRQPLRIVLANNTRLPAHLRLFNQDEAKTLLVTSRPDHYREISELGVEVLALPEPTIASLLIALGKREITSVLVEGGRTLQESFFQAGAVNKIHVYLANVIIGSLPKKHLVTDLQANRLGDNYHFVGYYQGEQ